MTNLRTNGASSNAPVSVSVQIVRVEGIEVGILLSKEEASRSQGVIHWIVSVHGTSEEEVISEKMMGRVLDDTVQSDNSTFEKSHKDQIPAKKAQTAKVKVTSKRKKTQRHFMTTQHGGEPEFRGGIVVEPRQEPKPTTRSGDGEVIEVKMLTGTLFIYRGENHRVEFARTV
jgi:hypothetical protein